MDQQKFTHQCYDAMGHRIKISTNSNQWAEEVDKYISLPEVADEREADIHLTLIEANSSAADEYIMLPEEELKVLECTLILCREVPYSTYMDNDKKHRWVDMSGLGRMFMDYSNGEATAVRFTDSGMISHYSDILFVYNILNSLLSRLGLYEVHASCARVGGKGVLFTGHSGRGKSTACYALLQKGYPVLSDEKILLFTGDQSKYEGFSISDVIKIREEAIHQFFPLLSLREPLCETEGEYSYKVSQLGHHAWLHSSPIDYLMVVEQSGEKKTRMERINPARVVGEFFPVTLKPYERFGLNEKFNFLMDFLERVPCYRLLFGTDMDDFVFRIEEMIKEG